MTRISNNQAALAMMVTYVILWGTGYWPTEVAAEHTETVLLSGLRVIGNAIPLILLAYLTRASWPRGTMLAWAALTGLVMIALTNWGTTLAVEQAGPGNAAVVINSAPLMVVAAGWLLLDERLSPSALVGVVMGFGGVILMVSSQLGGDIETTQLLIGFAVAALGAVGFAAGTLLLRAFSVRRGEEMDMLGFTSAQVTIAGAVLLVIGFAYDGTSSTNWSSGEFWVALAWIGPVAGVGFACYFLALRLLPAASVSAPLFLVPATAVVVEVARGNTPGVLVLIGMVLAIVGVALVSVPREMLASVLSRLRRDAAG
jgi:drug/metabolite transporter (DMT)-like permease